MLPPWWAAGGLPTTRRPSMQFNVVVLQPLIALIAGILILLVPRLLNYIVAVYLIVVGILGLVR
jgi:multisubunit Na+/H+ antiporter MnhF subunit